MCGYVCVDIYVCALCTHACECMYVSVYMCGCCVCVCMYLWLVARRCTRHRNTPSQIKGLQFLLKGLLFLFQKAKRFSSQIHYSVEKVHMHDLVTRSSAYLVKRLTIL